METVGYSEEVSLTQRQAVLVILQSVLESPHFSKSKRYPSFLQFVVHKALDEGSQLLKERTVGVEVFGRAANYDTSTDPIVRVAAGEVRRRMAAYFSEHPESPVRIEIPAGSYHAEFCFQSSSTQISASEPLPSQERIAAPSDNPPLRPAHPDVALVATVVPDPKLHARFTWIPTLWIAVVALFVFLIGSAMWWHHQRQPVLEDFWSSVLSDNSPALIVVGRVGDSADANLTRVSGTDAAVPVESNLAFDDAVVITQACSGIRDYKVQCKIVPAATVSAEDLHGKSLVLVGAFNNQWTRRLMTSLPYQFQLNTQAEPADQVRVIVQHEATGDVALGSLPRKDRLSAEFSKDYSIMARFRNDFTDSMTVVVAGLGRPGTSSAGQYLSSPQKLREVFALAPEGWKGVNFEAVLETDVVQGSCGHAKVIAARFW